MTHRECCDELASIKGGISEVPLGSVFLGNVPRADVVIYRPSYTRFCLDIYEVKVSRGDFLSDVRSKKYESYLPHCHRMYYATIGGVAEKRDIPDGIGLFVRGGKGWTCIKAAKPRDIEVSTEMLLSLLFHRQRHSRRDNTILSEKYKQLWSYYQKAHDYGKDVSRAMRFVDNGILTLMNTLGIGNYELRLLLEKEIDRRELQQEVLL